MLTYYWNTLGIVNAKQGIKSPQNFIAEKNSNNVLEKKTVNANLKKDCFKTQSSKEVMFYLCLRLFGEFPHCW